MKTADRFQNAHRRALARLMKSAAVLLSSLAPFVPASLWAATVEYDLTIARQEMNFTGHPVQAMTLNGQLPGPTASTTPRLSAKQKSASRWAPAPTWPCKAQASPS
jgi:hypothetical protein